MPNIRRMRFATKGPAVMPQKILTDEPWVDALTAIVEKGRKLHKEVVLHTHFNHPNEITGITEDAMNKLFERGITVRNQSVLQRGVNDTPETMKLLVKRLGHVNVHPYYVYVHDLVKGVEDLRTTSTPRSTSRSTCAARRPGSTRRRSSSTRPAAAASATRTRTSTTTARPGISVYTAPSVKPGQLFLYFDPLDQLSTSTQRRWADEGERKQMIDDAIAKARAHQR